MLFVLLIALMIVVLTLASFYFLYKLIKPYLKTKNSRRLIIKWFLILLIISWGASTLLNHLTKEPEYFEQGIQQLHQNKYIYNKIGKFNSYNFNLDPNIKDTVKHIIFQVQVNGDSLSMFLACTMNRINEKWILSRIQVDSVRTSTP